MREISFVFPLVQNISKVFLVKAVQYNDLYYRPDFSFFNNNVSFGRKNMEFDVRIFVQTRVYAGLMK
jgi:hypothetical protein